MSPLKSMYGQRPPPFFSTKKNLADPGDVEWVNVALLKGLLSSMAHYSGRDGGKFYLMEVLFQEAGS